MNSAKLYSHIMRFYESQKRDLPWRHERNNSLDFYHVLVSEFMLQQTQVTRVIPKYTEFLHVFPTIESLATSQLENVLKLWQGLGYNRRAKFLYEAAKQLSSMQLGKKKPSIEILTSCKGIGHNTAAAVLTYAYNQKHIFIETNVRTVFIHHYFKDEASVSDARIIPLLQQLLDQTTDYRTLYWALMDHGTYLKKTYGNNISKSKHYKKQSLFKGSLRQLRSNILKEILNGKKSVLSLKATIQNDKFNVAIESLAKDNLILIHDDKVSIKE